MSLTETDQGGEEGIKEGFKFLTIAYNIAAIILDNSKRADFFAEGSLVRHC